MPSLPTVLPVAPRLPPRPPRPSSTWTLPGRGSRGWAGGWLADTELGRGGGGGWDQQGFSWEHPGVPSHPGGGRGVPRELRYVSPGRWGRHSRWDRATGGQSCVLSGPDGAGDSEEGEQEPFGVQGTCVRSAGRTPSKWAGTCWCHSGLPPGPQERGHPQGGGLTPKNLGHAVTWPLIPSPGWPCPPPSPETLHPGLSL